jgi:type IV secretion system protein VirD4
LSEALGKETIDLLNASVTKGNSPSFGQNYQKLGKELMSVDELSVMDGSKCILQLRGVRPFLSDKFDITKHKNYRYLSDFDPKHAFDIAKHLSTKLKPKKGEVFAHYEYEAEPEDAAPDELTGEDFLMEGAFISDGAFLPDEAFLPDDSDEPLDLEPL